MRYHLRLLALFTLLPCVVKAGTIYLCKAYSGGMFWSSKSCGLQQATVDRIVSVPDDMSWDQKVQLGEQARRQGAALVASPAPVIRQQESTLEAKQAECLSLSASITHIDAQARQLLSGQMQDTLTAQRRRVRDRQRQLHC